ncbi:MarR family transcriptional regulator [Micromonospora profundi]|uniref:MarR family transcriptional regulator n=1 Tax=Micromonospora profundi TaxID=1420889 RepID=A0AAJ6HRF8_9ACTN|nr:MarR family transcriptional regulator [Micromonospora profundi]WLS43240.1 MarR family transcriptional regulator [Micromonospora profundi]
MDNTTDQTGVPSALDKVASALAALGQDTAAAIAQRAGVGYSTATKRLRTLEEAGQAEPLRADDGRTLWRHVANAATSTDSDDPPATTTDARRDPPHAPAPTDDDAHEAQGPDEAAPSPDEETGTAVAARPDDESTGTQPDDARRPAPDGDADVSALQDSPTPTDSVTSEATTRESEGDEAFPADAGDPAAVDTDGEADSQPSPDPAGSNDSVAPSSPAEAPSASSGGKPRRSKGSLRGAIRDVLEAHPDQPFTTSQLCKAIDQANEGTDSAKASAGAVVNAVHKLVTDGVAVQVVEKPATFQLTPTTN